MSYTVYAWHFVDYSFDELGDDGESKIRKVQVMDYNESTEKCTILVDGLSLTVPAERISPQEKVFGEAKPLCQRALENIAKFAEQRRIDSK